MPGYCSHDFKKAAGDYMLVDTPIAKADLCFVFGNKNHAEKLAQYAAKLYWHGYFDRILVSGGPMMAGGGNEGRLMRDTLLLLGVPDNAILVEDQAANTPQNLENSLPILDREIGRDNIKSVIAVGHEGSARRFLMTMEKKWPGVQKMFSAPSLFKAPRERWQNDPEFLVHVLNESVKTPAYRDKGDIVEIDIKKIRSEAQALKDKQGVPKHRIPKPTPV